MRTYKKQKILSSLTKLDFNVFLIINSLMFNKQSELFSHFFQLFSILFKIYLRLVFFFLFFSFLEKFTVNPTEPGIFFVGFSPHFLN